MALAFTRIAGYTLSPRTLYRAIETGVANTLLTSTYTARGNPFRVVFIAVSYSAAPTQTGVTMKLTSGAGAGYDNVFNTGTANAQYTSLIPTNDLMFAGNDALTIAAPAGGVGITASISIYLEEV